MNGETVNETPGKKEGGTMSEQTYTLTCENCLGIFNSDKAFPEHQWCRRCLKVYQAGYEEGRKGFAAPAVQGQIYLKGYDVGIREVVEWIEANKCSAYGEGNRHYCPNCDHQIQGVPDYLWQAFLKEKGIQEEQP